MLAKRQSDRVCGPIQVEPPSIDRTPQACLATLSLRDPDHPNSIKRPKEVLSTLCRGMQKHPNYLNNGIIEPLMEPEESSCSGCPG